MRDAIGAGAGVGTTSRESRLIGRWDGPASGPWLVVVAGLHGNEPAGVEAARRVVAELRRGAIEARGSAVFMRGNLAALATGTRWVHKDLNRQWTPAAVAALEAAPSGPSAPVEDRERLELLELLRKTMSGRSGPVYFLDLHTSSAEGPPFLTIGDTLRNRRFALHFPLPIILGLEERVDGSLLEFLNDGGCVTLGVEAGRHDAPQAVERHEAVLWLALVAAGIADAQAVPRFAEHRRLLDQAGRDVPRVIEVRLRHPIEPADQFRMRPGFVNFQPVRRGQPLARDRRGEIIAPAHGRILLPLYQGQGDDGFFIAREVRSFWLRLSALLRRLHADRLLRRLPGVHPDPEHPEVLLVDTRVARLYPLETFHLFGYRKLRTQGPTLRVTRRRHDLVPPARIVF